MGLRAFGRWIGEEAHRASPFLACNMNQNKGDIMLLDRETQELLGYSNEISLRPSDEVNYQVETTEQLLFDEEWDLNQFTAHIPQKSFNYLYWWKDEVSKAREYSTDEEDILLSAMDFTLERYILEKGTLNKMLWSAGIKKLRDLLR